MAASAGPPFTAGFGVTDEPSVPHPAVQPPGTRVLRALLLAAGGGALVLLTCAFALHELLSFDFWWHLRLGQYIVELREVPVTDPFTLPAQGRPYVDSHWLFQVALWGIYLAGGINGVILSVALLAVLTWLCVAFTHGRVAHFGLTVPIVGLAIVAASPRYLPRPDVVSVCFLAVTGLLLTHFRAHGRRTIYALPLLHLFWVNSHGLWILGVIVVAAYLAGDWLVPRLPIPAGWKGHALPGGRLKALGLVLAGMLALTFVTPQPLRQALYPLTLFREIQSGADWVAASVTELTPPLAAAYWPAATRAFVTLLGMTAAGLLVNVRRLDPVEVVLVAAFAYLALTAQRNMALFAVVAAPIAVHQWAAWLDARNPRSALRGLGLQAALACAAIAAGVAVAWDTATGELMRREGSLRRFGLGIAAVHHPQRLADFMEAAKAPGPVWNTPALGGYLTWRFWPERQTFIDGRWEIYGQRFLEAYSRTINDMDAWDVLADHYAVQAAAVFHQRPDYGPLLRHLHRSPGWALVYADSVAALFVRRSEETRDLIARHEVRLAADSLPSALPESPAVMWEDAFRDRPHFVGLQTWLHEVAPRRPDVDATVLLANLCFTLEADEAAAEFFARALAIDPDDYASHVSLGYLAQREERFTTATEHYVAAAEARPWDAEPWLRLAEVALTVGNVPQAAENIAEARRRAPRDPRIERLARTIAELHDRLE